MIRHWRSARGEGGGWLYSPAVPAFFFPGGYCCQPRRTDVIITTGNGAVTPYLRTTQTWNGAAWTTRTDIPLPGRFSAAGAYVNGLFHVTGGVGPAPLDSHHQWNPATDTWTTQTPVPLPRRSEHTALELNGSLFLWGGRASSNTLLNTTNEYRLGTWITGMPLPGPARTGARALPLQGRGYLFTGETALGVYTTRVDCYDPLTQTWTSKQPMTPPGRQGCGGFTFNNTCVVHGGGKPYTSRAESYSPLTNSWTTIDAVPVPARQYSTAASKIDGSSSGAIGGEDSSGQRLRRHEGFHSGIWLSLQDISLDARRLHAGG
jgi:N-acetylneuraminic acid mutarotase